MSQFKTTCVTAAAGLAVSLAGLLFIPSSAEATECSYQDGWSLCFDITGQAGPYDQWEVTFRNNHATEVMEIVCDDDRKTVVDWSSRGGLSQDEANTVAEFFCAI